MNNIYNYAAKKTPGYSDFIKKIYGYDKNTANITFQITEDCCLACSYCYQNHKTKNKMDFETGKKVIDQLLNDEYPTVNTNNTLGIILDFIGGEPLLEIELVEKIVDYYFIKIILLEHPWMYTTRINLCSNGILYFSPKFQHFLNKYQQILSLTISIDGNKELHDSCRIDKEGKGSYDQAIAAVRHYTTKYNTTIQNKMTLAPENISFLSDSIKNLINEGYKDIFLNCVFENVWSVDSAKILYQQLIKLANFLIDNDLYDKIYLSIFDEDIGHPMTEKENQNWCGGNIEDQGGFAIDYKGDFYPCIRYMESSLNGKQKPLNIGNINHGWVTTEQEKINAELLSNITRRTCSTDECFNCPIAAGCAWCSGYNYEEFGTPKSRATYICIMHRARTLANYYYWGTIQKKCLGKREIELFLPKEQALQIIDEKEYNKLLSL